MALLSPGEISNITKDISDIIGDSSVGGITIKYRLAGTTPEWNYDPADQELGETEEIYAESSVSAFKGSFSLDEVNDSGGKIEIGDVKFIVTNNSITGVLSVTDQVYESPSTEQAGTTYNVIDILRDPLRIAYFVQARSVG